MVCSRTGRMRVWIHIMVNCLMCLLPMRKLIHSLVRNVSEKKKNSLSLKCNNFQIVSSNLHQHSTVFAVLNQLMALGLCATDATNGITQNAWSWIPLKQKQPQIRWNGCARDVKRKKGDQWECGGSSYDEVELWISQLGMRTMTHIVCASNYMIAQGRMSDVVSVINGFTQIVSVWKKKWKMISMGLGYAPIVTDASVLFVVSASWSSKRAKVMHW